MVGFREISDVCFPTPGLALRSNDPVRCVRVGAFASKQAWAAWRARDQLALLGSVSAARRAVVFEDAYRGVLRWRYELARDSADVRGGPSVDGGADRFRTAITNERPNVDRLGEIGRLRDGAVWDEQRRVFTGGAETPAWRAMVAAGCRARRRFALEAADEQVLHNRVVLRDGRVVAGNRLLRGSAARAVGAELVSRVVARGLDISQFETGDLYTHTATEADRHVLHEAAIGLLAQATPAGPAATRRLWAEAAYLLYQSPTNKKGSDACIRVFLVAVGRVLLGQAPVLPRDIDLLAMTTNQRTFTDLLIAGVEGQVLRDLHQLPGL